MALLLHCSVLKKYSLHISICKLRAYLEQMVSMLNYETEDMFYFSIVLMSKDFLGFYINSTTKLTE